MDSRKLQRFAVFGLLYINLGRPQDVLPLVKIIHPGLIFGVLVLYSLLQPRDERSLFDEDVFQEKKWFIALWVMMILATFTSIYFRASVEFLIEYLKVIVLLFGLVRVLEDERDFDSLSHVFLLSVLTLCLPIVAGGISSDRVSIGTFYDPNDMAMFVSCSFPFLLYLLHNKTGKVQLFTLSAIILGVITVIATQSRMGFIALILNGFFYLILSPSSQSTAFRKFIILFSVAFVFVFFAGNFYWDRIKTTFEEGQTGSGRTLVWERGLQIAVENPFTGTGPGTFISAYGRMLKGGQFEEIGNEYDRAWKAAHNSYLVVAAELGCAGLLFFLMIIRTSLGQLNRVRKLCAEEEGRDHLRILANVSISSFCVFLFCALFLSQAYSSLFMALVACSVLVGRIYHKKSIPGSGEQVDT